MKSSLRRPPEATASSKRARCARCPSRASTTKLSRRSCRRRARQRAATPRRSLRGPPGRRVERLAAIAQRELLEAIVWGRPRGEWRVGWLRARLLRVSGTSSRSISSRYEPTSPRYANCSEPTEAPAKRVPTPGRVGLPGCPFGRPGAPTPWEAPHDHPQHRHRCHRRRRRHRRRRPARLTPHTRRRGRRVREGRSIAATLNGRRRTDSGPRRLALPGRSCSAARSLRR